MKKINISELSREDLSSELDRINKEEKTLIACRTEMPARLFKAKLERLEEYRQDIITELEKRS